MALGHRQPQAGVVAPPARPRQIHLGPGVQFVLGDLGGVMHRVSADKAGRQAQAAAGGHVKHGCVAAGAAPCRQAGGGFEGVAIEATDMVELLVNGVRQVHQESGCVVVHRCGQLPGPGAHATEVGAWGGQARGQGFGLLRGVGGWQAAGWRVGDDPVEGIGPQGLDPGLQLQAEVVGEFLEPDADRLIAVGFQHQTASARIGTDLQAVVQQPLGRVTAGPQPQLKGLQKDRSVVAVVEVVLDVEIHGGRLGRSRQSLAYVVAETRFDQVRLQNLRPQVFNQGEQVDLKPVPEHGEIAGAGPEGPIQAPKFELGLKDGAMVLLKQGHGTGLIVIGGHQINAFLVAQAFHILPGPKRPAPVDHWRLRRNGHRAAIDYGHWYP